MKFDYIIMNPPYNDVNGTMLHYKFLCKALEVAETVVSIQPATWMNQQKNRAGLPLNGRGATINIIQDTEHLFGDSNTNLGYNLSVSCFSNKYKDILVDWGNGNSSRYPDMVSVSMTDKHSMVKDIINKGNTNINHSENLQAHVAGYRGGKTPGYKGGCGYLGHIITDPSELKNKWIVELARIVPMRDRRPNNFGVMGIDPKKPVVFQHDGVGRIPASCCIFDTEQEARNCYAYLGSDLVRSYILAYKNSAAVDTLYKHIPWPATFDTDPALWTNEAVSDRAGLDQKEREWLAEMLPDCYNIRKPAVSHDTAG